MTHYVNLDSVKEKLRIVNTDTSLDVELNIYIDEVGAYVDRILQERFGVVDEYGYGITVPLTNETVPALTYDLITIATDLVEGKFRMKTTEDNTLWVEANNQLNQYIRQTFGWVEGHNFRRSPNIIISPTSIASGGTISITGTGFKPRGEVKVKTVDKNGNGSVETTSPSVILTDDKGDFASSTITVSSSSDIGAYEIVVHDRINHSKKNYTVTS